jgi:hypothetical protein
MVLPIYRHGATSTSKLESRERVACVLQSMYICAWRLDMPDNWLLNSVLQETKDLSRRS